MRDSMLFLPRWYLLRHPYFPIIWSEGRSFLFVKYSMSLYGVYYICRAINRTYYGIALGLYSVLILVSLQTAIFWGQYSSCDRIEVHIDIKGRNLEGIDCDDVSAMKSLCAFSVFLFLTHLTFTLSLFFYKDRILGMFVSIVRLISLLYVLYLCRISPSWWGNLRAVHTPPAISNGHDPWCCLGY